MVHHFQQVRTTSHYSDVIGLDDELLAFVNNLPPHFALEPDKSLDESSPYIPVHRFLLITEILFVRTSLHRPYLLRRLSSDRYVRSRAACFESALKDFEVRQTFKESMAKETRDSLSNAYREFQTTLIAVCNKLFLNRSSANLAFLKGIYLVLEPSGKYASQMHVILDHFVQSHEGPREVDETTRRELKTIEFLKEKASEVQKQHEDQSIAPGMSNGDSSDPAHLLLGLHQSTSPTPSFQNLLAATSDSSGQPFMSTGRIAFPSRDEYSANTSTSPTASGSPSADDESAIAQSLLDHWCNALSNGPPLDGSGATIPWGGPSADFGGWVGTAPTVSMGGTGDARLLAGLGLGSSGEGGDWNSNYWEALVKQIQRP